jgi:pimeloyl-ACP methyl ester carboxylesterase
MKLRVLLLLLGLFLVPAGAARATQDLPDNAEWSSDYIKSGDGTMLHADILRPKGLPKDAKTPVILSIGPYFNHSGQTGPAGPAEGTDFTPTGKPKPSDRFYDFVKGAKILERGYTFVMVDLRGFGGSGGCLDWAGPGEQMDVKAAVEWAASQPWSTGAVGMYGKSYDGVTGLIGAVENPKGLKAVVSMEPVYDLYRYLYSNGVRYENSAATPGLYDAIAVTPGPLLDDPLYNINGATTPDCLATNYAGQQDSNHDSEYWKARDLISKAGQGHTPLFLTQGFLENNTKPDGAFDFYNAVKAPKRAWFGMWDHVRGNEKDADGRLVEGRKGYFDEVMRFFDHYVRDVPLVDAATDQDPPVAVQTSDGSWRSETHWPPIDSKNLTVSLTPGTYSGDGQNDGTGSAAGHGLWTISPPFTHPSWYAGVPKVKLDLGSGSSPASGVVVDTYDIDADRNAILLSRNASLVGSGKVEMDLYGNDWKIPEGHRLGVLVTDTNEEWWLPAAPSSLELKSGTVTLPFLQYSRPDTIQGDPSVRLDNWLSDAPFEVAEDVITAATKADFPLPGGLRTAPPGFNSTTTAVAKAKRLKVLIAKGKKRTLSVYGNAPTGVKLTVKVLRGKRVVATRRVKTKLNAFRVRVKVKKAGRYSAKVSAKVGGKTLRAKSKRVRVR